MKNIEGCLEPLRRWRFCINLGVGDLNRDYVVKATLPRYKKGKWQSTKVVLRDVEGGYIVKQVLHLMKASEYWKGLDYEIKFFDAKGCVLNRYIVKKAKIIDVNFGYMDYNSKKTNVISIVFEPKECEFK